MLRRRQTQFRACLLRLPAARGFGLQQPPPSYTDAYLDATIWQTTNERTSNYTQTLLHDNHVPQAGNLTAEVVYMTSGELNVARRGAPWKCTSVVRRRLPLLFPIGCAPQTEFFGLLCMCDAAEIMHMPEFWVKID